MKLLNGAAFAEFHDKAKGSLMPGKLADVVVLDREISQIPPADLDRVKVSMTVVDGKVVFGSGTHQGP